MNRTVSLFDVVLYQVDRGYIMKEEQLRVKTANKDREGDGAAAKKKGGKKPGESPRLQRPRRRFRRQRSGGGSC